jgi:hypothetical protein|tara:strand:+ start:51 stop:251 length:201 start_codon:yes stop_codon:yes gene_type:complete
VKKVKIEYKFFGIEVWIRSASLQYVHMNLPFVKYGASPIWRAKLFKVHSPSQHMIGSTRYDMEIQI